MDYPGGLGEVVEILPAPYRDTTYHSGKLLLDELLTRTYPLEQINTAYAALERGEVARSLVLA